MGDSSRDPHANPSQRQGLVAQGLEGVSACLSSLGAALV
jgi:hypothetical protein